VILALHGFLGLASDWNSFSSLPIKAIDLWPDATLSIDQWAEKFIDNIGRDKPVLLGYSMGGRLAMHAALRTPGLFSGAIFVSANPGLPLLADRQVRLKNDLQWAKRFLYDPWSVVLKDWNAQPVLKDGTELNRNEAEFDRSALANAMDNWSLGRQGDLRKELEQLRLPHLFLTGKQDEKFTGLAKSLVNSAAGSHRIIEGAGHRVPWDNPEDFTVLVKDFLKTTLSTSR
jgi:2-succinyl-6-hydroxy-2,4-cyclohexadiene-1-carboxylate synthase